ncbi:MAG: glycosyltransferase family 4 protein [marine benthic group bacterium]|nr:glycosyltransferase family 4 protein [Candidatus Benthicola marisminoris]
MGGQERRILAEAAGMRDRGHDVWVVTPAGGQLANRASASGLRVVHQSFSRPLLPANALALASLVRRVRPHVLNTHSSADSWTAAMARQGFGWPGALVRSRHISARVRPGPLHRFVYGQADWLITTGEAVRRGLADSGLFPLDRSVSLPTGVDLAMFRPDPDGRQAARRDLGLVGDAAVIGVVAYLREDKGHEVLLRAMPGILEDHPDAVLVLVGDGPLRSELEGRVRDLAIQHSVQFAGLREDVASILSAFDVFCQPSLRNEGVPQSVLQAGACGLPVVSTRVGGIPEAVLDGETGILVMPGDAEGIGRAVSALLADRELGHRLGVAARAHVAQSFSLDRMLDLTEEAFADAVRSARARGRDVPGEGNGT